MDNLTNYLQSLNAPQQAKADAWEAFNSSSNTDEFSSRIRGLSLPDDAKAQLWEMHNAQQSPASRAMAQNRATAAAMAPQGKPEAPGFFSDERFGGLAAGAKMGADILGITGTNELFDKTAELGSVAGSYYAHQAMRPAEAFARATGHSGIADVAEGIGQGVSKLAGSTLTDPRQLALMGGMGTGALGKAASLGFAGQMGHGAYTQAGELGSVMDREDVPMPQKAELATSATLSTIMAGGAFAHGVMPGEAPPPTVNSRPATLEDFTKHFDPNYQGFPEPEVPSRTTQATRAGGRIDEPSLFADPDSLMSGDKSTPDPNARRGNIVSQGRTFGFVAEPTDTLGMRKTRQNPAGRAADPETTQPPTPTAGTRQTATGRDYGASGESVATPKSNPPTDPASIIADAGLVGTPLVKGEPNSPWMIEHPKYKGQGLQVTMKPEDITSADVIKNALAKKVSEVTAAQKSILDASKPSIGQTPENASGKDLSSSPIQETPKPSGEQAPLEGKAPKPVNQNDLSSKGASSPDEMGRVAKPPKAKAIPADAGSVVAAAVEHLQKGNNLTPKGYQALESLTGRTLPRQADPRFKTLNDHIIHELKNWQNAEHIAKAVANLPQSKTVAPDTIQATRDNAAKMAMALIKERGMVHAPALEAISKAADALTSVGEMGKVNARLKGFSVYAKSLAKGKPIDVALMDALDAAKSWKERGAVGGQQARYSDKEVQLIANGHVRSVVEKFENYTDARLLREKAWDRLNSEAFNKQVGIMNDQILAKRVETLRSRTAGISKPSGTIESVVNDLGGYRLTSGDLARGDLRQGMATTERMKAQRESLLKDHINRMDGYSIEQSLKVMNDMENGDFKAMTPEDAQAMQSVRRLLDEKRDAIANLGTGKFEHFIENYYPHLWSNVGRMQSFIARNLSKTPFAGTGTFLKERYYETVAAGVDAGLEPITYNPTKMALLRLHEMDKYLAAHTFLNQLKERGNAVFVPYGSEAKLTPEGWTALNDSIFRTFDKHPLSGDNVAGRFYAPPDAAKSINNHLMPGLAGHLVYDVVRSYNNVINQATLSISAFHGFETVFNAAVSDGALAVQNVFRGRFKQAVLPAVRALSIGGSAIDNFRLGTAVMGEYANPGTYQQLSRLADELGRAGVRVGQPDFYKNGAVDKLGTSFKKFSQAKGFDKVSPALKVAFNTIGAAMEKVSAPIMNHLVPRIKLGAAARMAMDVMDRLPDANPDVLRKQISDAVDSADNRFGQVIYDNYFMNKIAKDLGMIGFRSLGWNMGTFKELGGGMYDLAKAGKEFGTGNKAQAQLSQRLAYSIALPVMVGYLNALTMYSLSGKVPNSMTDYFYPQDGTKDANGKPNRVYWKTYMHDAKSFVEHPVDTISHKAAPWISQAIDVMYRNADYYGTEIRHTNDPMPKQAEQLFKYWLKSSSPFSLQNLFERERRGSSAVGGSASFVGLLPAPKSVGKTPAEELAYQYATQEMARGPHTQEEFDHRQTVDKFRSQYENKQIGSKDLLDAMKANKLGENDVDNIMDATEVSPLERYFKHINNPEEALEVWDKATPDEQKLLKDSMYDKWDAIEGKYNAAKLTGEFKRRLSKK